MKGQFEMAIHLSLFIQTRSWCVLTYTETKAPRSITDAAITTANRQLTPHNIHLVSVFDLWS